MNQLSRGDHYYPINRLNPATLVSLLFIFVLLLWTSNFQEKRIIIPLTDKTPPRLCHLFVVCSYLYCCCGHPIFKRRELRYYHFNRLNPVVCLFLICIIDAHAQFAEEDDYYLINKLNHTTFVGHIVTP